MSTVLPSAWPGARNWPKAVSVSAPWTPPRITLMSEKNAAAALSTGAL